MIVNLIYNKMIINLQVMLGVIELIKFSAYPESIDCEDAKHKE